MDKFRLTNDDEREFEQMFQEFLVMGGFVRPSRSEYTDRQLAASVEPAHIERCPHGMTYLRCGVCYFHRGGGHSV